MVGEERGSDGAKCAGAAGARLPVCRQRRTDRSSALAWRRADCYRVRLKATGRAAHSSFPELGESAIDRLLDALVMLRSIALPVDPVLGTTHYTVGLISGGVAPNVVSPSAEAELLFRTVSEAGEVHRALAPLEALVALEPVFDMAPVTMMTVPGMDTAVFPYGTDIPFLGAWAYRCSMVQGRFTSRIPQTNISTSMNSEPRSTATCALPATCWRAAKALWPIGIRELNTRGA